VVLLHGVNMVAKGPNTPAEDGFDGDDAAWLADNGFELVRLGLEADELMPTPGVIDTFYLESFLATVRVITDHDLYVLLDLHQDGWGPGAGANGFPQWMDLFNGAENNMVPWPSGYTANPAVSAAFGSLWNNQAGPDGVGIADQVAVMWAALAKGVGSNPGVLGYDLLNEPWPGTGWAPCLNGPQGCPDLDAGRLDPFHARTAAAIREHDSDRLIFGEPFVLFNFGEAPTSIAPPGGDGGGLAFHMYASNKDGDAKVIANAVAWADANQAPILAGEFSGIFDIPAAELAERQIAALDAALIPWIWWHYGPSVTEKLTHELVRPHPVTVAGTPTALVYDLAIRTMAFTYSATGPDGTNRADTRTELDVPARTYPAGYRATVVGGTVTSEPGADTLTVIASSDAPCVAITISPADAPPPAPPTSSCSPPTSR
jgi:endoglycosylceramidase